MGMPLVLFRDCGGKVLLRYVAYIEHQIIQYGSYI